MEAKVKVKCPHCGQEGQVRAEFLGKKTRCARCSQLFVVTPVKAQEEDLVVPMESLGGTRETICPGCGTLVMAKPGAVGILCPSCGKVFTAPPSPSAAPPPPPLTMTCPYCRASAPIEAEWIGQEGQCTECGRSFIIQADGQPDSMVRNVDGSKTATLLQNDRFYAKDAAAEKLKIMPGVLKGLLKGVLSIGLLLGLVYGIFDFGYGIFDSIFSISKNKDVKKAFQGIFSNDDNKNPDFLYHGGKVTEVKYIGKTTEKEEWKITFVLDGITRVRTGYVTEKGDEILCSMEPRENWCQNAVSFQEDALLIFNRMARLESEIQDWRYLSATTSSTDGSGVISLLIECDKGRIRISLNKANESLDEYELQSFSK